jgi:hypothetical protein
MERTVINIEVKRIAAFLARLVRRNDKNQVELIEALEGIAEGYVTDLSVLDKWVNFSKSKELTHLAAVAIRHISYTKANVLQACNVAVAKKTSTSLRKKSAELLCQRRDLIETLIW